MGVPRLAEQTGSPPVLIRWFEWRWFLLVRFTLLLPLASGARQASGRTQRPPRQPTGSASTWSIQVRHEVALAEGRIKVGACDGRG